MSSPRHDNAGTEPICISPVHPRRVSGRSNRTAYHAPRRRKLSHDQEVAIRSEAGSRTLRELAATFGVSHETIRTVLRRELPAIAKMLKVTAVPVRWHLAIGRREMAQALDGGETR